MIKSNAYTMIELIFVLVIIGVLAAVGIPKLLLTRSDARASVISTRLSNCIVLAGKAYLQDGAFDLNETNCKEVTEIDPCFVLDADDQNGTLKVKNSDDESLDCISAQKIAVRNSLSSEDGLAHQF